MGTGCFGPFYKYYTTWNLEFAASAFTIHGTLNSSIKCKLGQGLLILRTLNNFKLRNSRIGQPDKFYFSGTARAIYSQWVSAHMYVFVCVLLIKGRKTDNILVLILVDYKTYW